MDPARLDRYRDKIDHARARLASVQDWAEDAAEHLKDRLAVYKAFQEAAEAAGDLVAMALADAGRPPKDDHRNLDLAAEAGILSRATLDALHEATGLRNRLVHEYNGLEDRRALESILELGPALERFLQEVEAWCDLKR